MPRIARQAIVPYTAELMFELVDDIASYPQFLPWCGSAVVHERSPAQVQATLELRKGPLHYRLTTRNTLRKPAAIDMELLEGPFRHLHGRWRFESIEDTGCRVSLELDFEFGNRLVAATLGRVFDEIANSLVERFCRRAHDCHGRA